MTRCFSKSVMARLARRLTRKVRTVQKLPGLIGASQIVRETEQLMANAPDIIIA